MKKTGLILMVLVVSAGCAQQQLAMMDAKSEPAKFPAGAATIVSVRVVDPEGVVAKVTATVREYTPMVLDLNDGGEDGDKVAGDGVWSVGFDVPGEADAGEYHWDFEAFDANGDPVKVATDEGDEELLTAEAVVEVLYEP
ncbi:MAG: hypothetical protein JSU70_13860 [Phycisphaerales bacterium]|nr:MAG: hypothetical protein JSU70_13860 [Phycisphaerales bacterium]